MQELLDKLTLEQLKDEPRELAETIGLDAFKRLVSAYGAPVICMSLRFPR